MKPAFYSHRVAHVQLEGHANGLRYEVPTIHAPTSYYASVTRPGMNTEARINRAVALHEMFDAEARHSFG